MTRITGPGPDAEISALGPTGGCPRTSEDCSVSGRVRYWFDTATPLSARGYQPAAMSMLARSIALRRYASSSSALRGRPCAGMLGRLVELEEPDSLSAVGPEDCRSGWSVTVIVDLSCLVSLASNSLQ